MIRFLFQLIFVVTCGLGCVFTATAVLMTWGVYVADHQDYFSPGSDVSTTSSSFVGGAVLAAAALIGFGGSILLVKRSGRSK